MRITSIKQALTKKRVQKAQLTKLDNKVISDDFDIKELDICDQKLKDIITELNECFDYLFENGQDSDIDTYASEQEQVFDIRDQIEYKLNKMKKKDDSKESPLLTNRCTTVRLPKISLPIFSGSLHEWLSFKDIFIATIHQNNELSGSMKLQYLKSSLKGDALRIIQSISVVDANYDLAWSLLEDRYSNKREQVYAHLKRFMSIQNIQHENPNAILSLIDISSECLRSLEILDQKIDSFSSIMLCYTLSQKLDANTKLWWERHLKKDELPNMEAFKEFLKEHARTLNSSNNNVKRNYPPRVLSIVSESSEKKSYKCVLCHADNHTVSKCGKYQKMSVQERVAMVKKLKLCFNCLLSNHNVKVCHSNFSCFKCKKRHHSSLCFGNQSDSAPQFRSNNSTNTKTITPDRELSTNLVHNHEQVNQVPLNVLAPPFQIENQNTVMANVVSEPDRWNSPTVLLSTAVVYVRCVQGEFIAARSVIDCGSMCNLITNELADLLYTPKRRVNMALNGVNGAPIKVKFKTTTTIENRDKSFSRELDFLITPKITNITPSKYINTANINFPRNINLADRDFNKPGKISMLLGNEIFFQLLLSGQIYVPNSNLILQNSAFGYLIGGSVCNFEENKIHCGLIAEVENLDNELRKFWEIEEVLEKVGIKNPDEVHCDKLFSETYRRDATGKFVVQMPLKKDPQCLGESKNIAFQKLNYQYKRLEKDPVQMSLYTEFMKEYKDLGHMQEVKETEEPKIAYYIPHLGVFRPEKNSTKMRVVFNASQPTTTGESLNSIQLNGGVIQDELFSIILRFRMHRFAFTADVMKMYRMILIDPNQHNLQRILWKDSVNDPVKIYELCTVTYGTTSAPYLAMRCLKQLAIDGQKEFPLASRAIEDNFYMDDVLTGSSELESTKKLQKELIDIFETCGMKLHKWCSNHPQLLEITGISESYNFNQVGETKALGLKWNPQSDTFEFDLVVKNQNTFTKREVLSTIARIFDPLGLIGPIVTTAKIFMQGLWGLQSHWDDKLPDDKVKEWLEFQDSLGLINEIKINRFVLSEDFGILCLKGYSDASELAYGAVIYVVSQSHSGKLTVQLLCSKSRVAPIKTVTIPRLELCGAVLLAKLMRKVMTALKVSCNSVHYYSDSTIVLSWLQKSPSELKTFVATRVSTIQSLTDVKQWKHVRSSDNPADMLSRGCKPQNLLQNNLWWNCEQTLNQSDDLVPIMTKTDGIQSEIDRHFYLELKPCAKSSSATMILIKTDFSVMNDVLNCSNNYFKTIRVFCYVLRFLNFLKGQKQFSRSISNEEFKIAESYIIRDAQKAFAEKDIQKLSNLKPFVDEEGILRVGGRLTKANIPYDQKYPIILHKKCKLNEKLFYTYHLRFLHVGPQALLNAVRQKYWPLGGRNSARRAVHSCIVCFKNKPLMSSQMMADLPKERVSTTHAFNCTGLDLCGPFYVTYKHQRRGTLNKIYVCIFICFSTKAIHLEVLSDLTSEALIAALKRFFSRRGKSATLFSDNATNMVGAKSELKKLSKLVTTPDDTFSAYLTSENVEWKFIPPKSPHFGGLWEAGVKSVKYHLVRAIGKLKFNYEEFETIIIQIEGILNSRPITPISSDLDSYEVLTPGHFLIGRSISALPEPDITHLSESRLSRWQRTSKVVQSVWRKWKIDYLNTLQQRSKWMVEKQNLKIGAMVLIKEDFLPCTKWLLGRIVDVFPSSDGKVRVVNIRTQNGEFKRAVTKIAVLPIES